jgi:hypothetical protein
LLDAYGTLNHALCIGTRCWKTYGHAGVCIHVLL